MREIKNQTIYQCEYCEKRFLTKSGVKKHENKYCYLSPIPKQAEADLIKSCNHNWKIEYSPMAGEEHLLEPSHQYCVDCGVNDYELKNYL